MGSNEGKGWSPYLAGALSGVVIVLSVWLYGMYFGASTTFVRAAGYIERVIFPKHFSGVEYFKMFVPKADWQWAFVVGILIGSFISAVTSGSFHPRAVPEMWEKRFGPGIPKRAAVAFLGGMVAMIGARLAGG